MKTASGAYIINSEGKIIVSAYSPQPIHVVTTVMMFKGKRRRRKKLRR